MTRTQWWLGGTTPQAWRMPVVAFAVGALLSGPAVSGAAPVDLPPFVQAAPDIHPAQKPGDPRGGHAAGVRAGGGHPAARTRRVASPVAGGLLSLSPMAANPRSSQSAPTTASPDPAPRRLADTAFDGMLVAAIGTGVAGAGWLLMLAAGRRLRRRSR